MTIAQSKPCLKKASNKVALSTKPVVKKLKFRLHAFANNSNNSSTTAKYSDQALQGTESRRRYLRRGSKAPTMMLISQAEINRINDEYPEKENHKLDMGKIQRRSSIVTSLMTRFDSVSILDKNTTYTIRRASSLQNIRRYSIDLLLKG